MNAGSGQNLNWFFQNWFFTNNYLDLSITKVTPAGGKAMVTVKNVGGFAIPFDVVVTYTDGKTDTTHKTPAVWKANQREVNVTVNASKKIKSVTLDNGIYVDATPADNTWSAK
ncbi:hypothetical protein D3C72_1747540 [compost metagenome]